MKRLCLLLIIVVLLLSGCATPYVEEPTLEPKPKTEIEPVLIPESEPEIEKIHTGEVIIDGIVFVKGNWEPIILIDNSLATNPTYSELKAFLLKDQTDNHDYILSFTTRTDGKSYVCGDFAEALHNNAEKAGIRAGLVDFPDVNHVSNVFETEDKGLVLIDCTGEFWIHPVTPPWMASFGEPFTWDKVTYFEKGKPLGFIEISVAEIYGFTYSNYELWKQKKADFDYVFDSYPEEITYEEIGELRELAKDLGGFFEEEGIVYSFTIVWEGK